MSGFKDDIPRILIQKFLCQVLVLLTLLEFIYSCTSKNRTQPKLENFSGAATCFCGSQRDQPLHAASAAQVDEAPAYCIVLKTDLLRYQWLVIHLYRELGQR